MDSRYAPWNPAERFMREGRARHAAIELDRIGRFPAAGAPCLEVGYGELGWLAELVGWGLREDDLHGIELDAERAAVARAKLPGADLRVGDASELPWPDDHFRLVVASTVFTSILAAEVRQQIAAEVERVLAPGGAFVWYDFAFDSPGNESVKGLGEGEIRRLFPNLRGSIRRVTLAPPLARAVAPRAWWLAWALETLPFLRTHLLAVLVPRAQ